MVNIVISGFGHTVVGFCLHLLILGHAKVELVLLDQPSALLVFVLVHGQHCQPAKVGAGGDSTRLVPLKPLALGVLKGVVHVLLLVGMLYHLELLVVGQVAGAQGSHGGGWGLGKHF